MIVIIGAIIVLGSVLGGFIMAGGHPLALMHLSEFVIIGGAALGALVLMSPKKVLMDLVKQALGHAQRLALQQAGLRRTCSRRSTNCSCSAGAAAWSRWRSTS